MPNSRAQVRPRARKASQRVLDQQSAERDKAASKEQQAAISQATRSARDVKRCRRAAEADKARRDPLDVSSAMLRLVHTSFDAMQAQ